MKKQPLLLGLLILLAVVASVTFFKMRDRGVAAPIIRVAANMPMSGELAFYGGELRDGLLMAVAEKGSTLPQGASIDFDWGDNKFNAKDAVTVLQRQLQREPTIYTSALKPQVMAIEHEVEAAGIPHLAWVLDLTPNPASTKNNFRSWVSFKLESDVFADYAKKRGAKTVVLCFLSLPSTEEAYGQYLLTRLRDEVGANVIIERYAPDVGAGDYRNIAAKVASHKPDLVLVNGFIPNMVGIIKGLRPLGVIKDGNTIASLDMLDAAGALSSAESEGIVVAAPPIMIEPTEAQRAWQDRFAVSYGRRPSYHAAFAYDAGLVLIDAATRLKLPATHQQWLSAILQTNGDGIVGKLKFGPDQSLITVLAPAIYRSGRLVPLK